MALSFPWPVNGTVRRPLGQGCFDCVHSPYCPAAYWFKRNTFKDLEPANGTACTSWSNNPADVVTTPPTADDLNIEQRMYIEGVGSEPNRCGIIGGTTGGSSRE